MRDRTPEELDTIGGADDLEIAALGPDGTLRPATATATATSTPW